MRKTASPAALYTLAIGFFVLFVAGGSRFAIGLTLRPMVDDLGWDRSDLGGAVALFQLVSAIFTFAAGRFADRMSLRFIFPAGLCLSALGIGLMSVVAAPWQALMLYGVVFAIGNGLTSTSPVGVMVTRAFPGRAGFANGVAISGLSVGQLVVIAALAAVLASVGWRSVFVWLGVGTLILAPFFAMSLPAPPKIQARTAPVHGLPIRAAVRTRQFWLLLVIYAICGFSDFFVSTHVVAFAQDRGVSTLLAGNLLALMGLTGLIGVVAAGVWSDRVGPIAGTAWSFVARVAVFGLIYVNQSPISIAIFALVFGATFLVTAPMTVLFVRDSFGTANLGALTGIVTMVHQIWGGLGAYVGARIFDATGSYDDAFALLFTLSAIATVLSLMLDRSQGAIQGCPCCQAPAGVIRELRLRS